MPGPLEGLRVIDLTRMLAGPYTTMLFADLGADVVKVEAPQGDSTRGSGPFRPGDSPEGLGGYFQSINRGKRSIVLDLKTDQGRADLLVLVRRGDVLVENFATGVMERLGLGYEVLAEANPRLVYGAVRGFGDPRTGESPYVNWPAFDIVAQAMGGFSAITGTAEGLPLKSGPGIGDVFPGTLLAVGILAAVQNAQRTGLGQFVDVAMYDAMVSLCERSVYQYSYLGEVAKPMGNGHPLFCPFDILATKDGWVSIAAPFDHQWAIIADAIGQPELATDPRYATNAARVAHADEVRGLLDEWLTQRTNAEVVGILGGRIPMGPVNDVAAIVADPHMATRDMLVEVEQPGSDRPVTIAGEPIKFTRTPSKVHARAATLGEHAVADVLNDWTERTGDSTDR
jgi:crotonobetainyl-CoA:carnitine CoA-transferase CaiB-like acyl-CoA transferase